MLTKYDMDLASYLRQISKDLPQVVEELKALRSEVAELKKAIKAPQQSVNSEGTKFQVCGSSHSDDEGCAGYDGYGDKVYQHHQYNPITGE